MNALTKNSAIVSLIALISVPGGPAIAIQDWQLQRLLEPTPAHLNSERQGRVYIFDGLHESTVDRALDTQFGRIQNMMFVDVRHTADDGTEYFDDDCD
jgi:hypothetical protein